MNLILVGASDHARYTLDIVRKAGVGRVVGIVDDRAEVGLDVDGVPVVGRSDELVELKRRLGIDGGLVAIGDNHVRRRVAARVREQLPDFVFPVAIHPFSCIGPDVEVGEGTVMMAGVIVNNSCRIGQHVFLATKASLDHDSTLEDAVSMSPGATTGGRVHVGACSTISIGATVIHGRTIGAHTVIGAGATVVSDIPSHSIAFGTPCRVVRARAEGDRYL